MRTVTVLVSLALIVLATAGAAGGMIGSSFAGGQLTVTTDGDSVALSCSGGAVKVNGADPPGGSVACSDVTRLIVHGGDGNDTVDLSGLAPAAFTNLHEYGVIVNAGGGNDVITGSSLADVLTGDEGSDTIRGGPGNDFIAGDPSIGPQTGLDDLDGQAGSDTVVGGAGDTVVDSGGADDFDNFIGTLGTSGNDSVSVLADGSVVTADGIATRGSGFEITEIDGAAGDDILDGSAATVQVLIDAGDGNDTLRARSAGSYLFGGEGDDTLDASASTADVRLDGGGGNDLLNGGDGSDSFYLDGGVDSIRDPGGAHDSIGLAGAAGSVDLSKQSGEIKTVSATQSLSLTGVVENLYGTGGNDTLVGNAANNFIDGNGGDDTVSGGAGDDLIGIGSGADHVDGELGSDSYFAFSIVDVSIADTGTSGSDVLDYDCAAGAVDTGSSLTAGGATLAYSGVETRRCGTFSDGTYEPIFIPQADPPAPAPSGGGGSGTPSASPASPAAPAPVVVRSRSADRVVASITSGSGGSLGLPASTALSWTAATFPRGAVLVAATAPSAFTGFSSGSVAVDLAFAVGGTPLRAFAAPIEVTFPAVGPALPAYSTDGGLNWTAIPRLAGATLPDGQPDGFYVDSVGATHVLTRHATTFGLLGPVVVRSGAWVPAKGPRRIVAFLAPERPATATIMLVTRAGKVVSHLSRTLPAGTTRLVFSLPRSARPGLYLVKAHIRSGPSPATVVLRVNVPARASK